MHYIDENRVNLIMFKPKAINHRIRPAKCLPFSDILLKHRVEVPIMDSCLCNNADISSIDLRSKEIIPDDSRVRDVRITAGIFL